MATKTLKLVFAISGGLLVAGCVPHLTLQQCQSMNWHHEGYQDGLHGNNKRDLSRSIADCAKFNISVNAQQYSKGWEFGVRQYCKPANGLRLGTNGENYNHVCPADMVTGFEKAWRRGLERYCIPSTGYNLGRSGKPFPNFCSGKQVVKFRNAYDSGRRIYDAAKSVQAEIDNTDAQRITIANEIRKRNEAVKMAMRKKSQPGLAANVRNQQDAIIKQAQNDIRQLRKQLDRLTSQRSKFEVQKAKIEAKR